MSAIVWPPYIQLQPSPHHPTLRVADRLIDLLCLCDPRTRQARTFATFACLGGAIDCVPIDASDHLTAQLRSQILRARVHRREAVRTVVAEQMIVARLDAAHQDASARAINPPMTLVLTVFGVLRSTVDELRFVPIEQHADLVCARLDFLDAVTRCVPRAFPSTDGQSQTWPQLHLPAGPLAHGNAASVLVYPLVTVGDTYLSEQVLLQLTYETLTQLQADVREQSPEHRLARIRLPAPHARTVLATDPAPQMGILQRAARWLGDGDPAVRTAAATLPLYRDLIASLLPTFAASHDPGLIDTIEHHTLMDAPPPWAHPTTPSVPSASALPPSQQPPPSSPPPPAPTRTVPANVTPGELWADDFALPASAPATPAATTGSEFETVPDAPAAAPGDDWAGDFAPQPPPAHHVDPHCMTSAAGSTKERIRTGSRG